jgi:cytochrome c biogenesis protein CcdA
MFFHKKSKAARAAVCVVIFCFMFFCQSATAARKQVKVMFFYLSACDGCNEAQKYMSEAETLLAGLTDRPDAKISMVNTYQPGGYNLLLKYMDAYKVPEKKQMCPIVFIGNHYLVGEDDIEKNFVGAVLNAGTAPDVGGTDTSESPVRERFSAIRPLNVFLTGLINGLNPCSFSMLLFFVSLLGVRRINVLRAGAGFCAGKFCAYIVLGIVSYKILDAVDMDRYRFEAKVILAVVAAAIAFLNIRDFVFAKKERYERIVMQLPQPVRKLNHIAIRRFTGLMDHGFLIPVSALLGAFISVGEFLCTGQIYLATILYVMRENTVLNAQALFYFIIYSLAAVLPLAVVVAVVYRGRAMLEVSEAIRSRLPLIKLLNAGFFLLFGALVLVIF